MASRKAFLQLARARFKQGTEADLKQCERELEDLRFYAGEQWDRDLLDTRKGQTLGSGSNQQVVPARPSLTINKTREPVRQVLNQERQSEMAIELVPADDWGGVTGPIDHSEIELREGLVRRIQRDSEAADARTWAFTRATISGRGYYLVNTRYVPGKTWDQEVYIHRIYNQASVTLDPAHEQPDGSDARWGFIWSDIPYEEYAAQYGTRNGKKNRLTAQSLSDNDWRALGDEAPDWFTTDDSKTRYVRVGDYYYEHLTSRTLCKMVDGSAMWSDEIPDGLPDEAITDRRTVIERTIRWAKIDGCDDDVLEETDWPGHYLPIIKVVGEELQPYDQERRCEGIVRPMEDPCRGNNYIVSKFVERIGLTPIPPYLMAVGQDESLEDEWNAINTRTLGRVHYNQVDSFNRPAPPPIKLDANAQVADLATGLQLFNEAIVSTSRVPETALGHIDPSVKSGKLAKALIAQAEQGNSNYLDNLRRSMRHEARVVNDLLYPIYGRPGRLARMMDPSGKMASVLIGQPFTTGQGPQPQPVPVPQGAQMPDQKLFKLTPDAEFNVAVRISRATDTRRQEVTELLTQIVDASPEQMAIVGDLIWKFADAPEHEELEKRYKAVLSPAVQAVINGKPQVPPEIQAQMAQMQGQMQQLQQLADKNRTDLQKAQMDGQVKLQIEAQNNASREKIALIQATAAFQATQIKVDAENARTVEDALEERLSKLLDLKLKHVDTVHAQMTQVADQMHDVGMAHLEHQHALEQGQQAAALAPPPTENGAGA